MISLLGWKSRFGPFGCLSLPVPPSHWASSWVLGLPANGKQHRIHQAQLSHNKNLRLPMRRQGLFRSAARSAIERRSHRQGVCNWPVIVLECLVSALSPPTRTTSLPLQFAGKYNKMLYFPTWTPSCVWRRLHGKDSHQLCRSGRNSVSGGAAYSAGAEVGTCCAAMGEMGPGSTRAAVAAAMSSRDRVACSNALSAATQAP